MKKKQHLILLLLSFPIFIYAQQWHPCGTPPYKSEWLKTYQKNPAAFANHSRNDTVIYAPITLHIVGLDNGTGLY